MLPRLFCVMSLALIGVLVSGDASAAKRKKGHVKFHQDWDKHPASRYAAMTAPSCTAELRRRQIAFTPAKSSAGVLAPVRLPKDVGGVVYRTEAPAHLRATNPYDVFDCRLVLALSDFSKILRAHDIDLVLIFSAWRPPGKKWPKGKLGTRHPGALAIDARRFGKKQKQGEKARAWLDVEKDYHGTMGAPACGADAAAPSPTTLEAKELHSIVCEAADQHVFTSILTPNYNRAHKNHFHLEVTPGVRWSLVR